MRYISISIIIILCFVFNVNISYAASLKKTTEAVIKAYQSGDLNKIYQHSYDRYLYQTVVVAKVPKFEQDSMHNERMKDNINSTYKEHTKYFPKTIKWKIVEEQKATTSISFYGQIAHGIKCTNVYVEIDYIEKDAPQYNNDKLKKSIYIFTYDANNQLLIYDNVYKPISFFEKDHVQIIDDMINARNYEDALQYIKYNVPTDSRSLCLCNIRAYALLVVLGKNNDAVDLSYKYINKKCGSDKSELWQDMMSKYYKSILNNPNATQEQIASETKLLNEFNSEVRLKSSQPIW
jgi:hypothetical protein